MTGTYLNQDEERALADTLLDCEKAQLDNEVLLTVMADLQRNRHELQWYNKPELVAPGAAMITFLLTMFGLSINH